MGDDLQHRNARVCGKLADLLDRRCADFARRLVDNSAQAHIVTRIDDDSQIAVDVLDLLAVKEALAADDAVWDACAGEVSLDGVGLRVHAVKHGVVFQGCALAQVLADDVGNVAGLVLLIRGGVVLDFLAVAALRPEGLALAPRVILDDAVGGVQNICGGAIVLFQPDRLRARKDLLEVQNIFNRGATELVDRLVVVANDADVVRAASQQAHQMELRDARVLILVHDDVAEAVLVVFPRLGVVLQQAHRVEDEVVKVHGARRFQAASVGGVDFRDELRLRVGGHLGGHVLGGHELIFIGRDLPDGRLDRQEFVVDHQVFVDLLDDALLVVGVIDREALREADALGVAAKHPHAGRVEGRRVNVAADGVAQHGAQTLLQLTRSLVREGDGQHVPRARGAHGEVGRLPRQVVAIGNGGAQVGEVTLGHEAGKLLAAVGAAEADDVRNTVDEHSRLAGARARQNEQRPLGGEDGLPLHGVEPGKPGFDILIAQGEIFSGDVGHDGDLSLMIALL